jgi:hypothetical protein
MIQEVAAFAVATLGESVNPGPTLVRLVSARTRSRQEAWGVVLGVALANVAWVIIVVLLKSFGDQVPPWPWLGPLLKAIAALLLVFIATRAAASAAITGTEAYILGNWGEQPETDSTSGGSSFVNGVYGGLYVHFVNPLSFTYYLGAYSGTLASDPSLALLFSVVAVVIDFVVYGLLAFFPVAWIVRPSSLTFAFQRILSLLSSFAMLFLVAHVFAIDKSQQLHGLRNLFMLLGFLFGTIWEAEKVAVLYGGKKNKLLWRGVLVWQSAFGATAIVGTILSVLVRIDPNGFGIDQSWISAIAICSLVAVVITAALSYARARGEMLDEITSGQTQNQARTLLINSPMLVFPFLFVGFVVLFGFFVASGFSNQVHPSAAEGVGPVSTFQ